MLRTDTANKKENATNQFIAASFQNRLDYDRGFAVSIDQPAFAKAGEY